MFEDKIWRQLERIRVEKMMFFVLPFVFYYWHRLVNLCAEILLYTCISADGLRGVRPVRYREKKNQKPRELIKWKVKVVFVWNSCFCFFPIILLALVFQAQMQWLRIKNWLVFFLLFAVSLPAFIYFIKKRKPRERGRGGG